MSAFECPLDNAGLTEASGIASQMLDFFISLTDSDGHVLVEPTDMATQHLLLVLSAWQHPMLSGMAERAANWFAANPDDRDADTDDLNPFRLTAMLLWNREYDLDYVRTKTATLRRCHRRDDGHVVLQISASHKLANHLEDVFPTMMAVQLLLSEGSAESVAAAEASLAWVKRQMDARTVHKNLWSNTGFAAYLASLFEHLTSKPDFGDWKDALIASLLSSQKDGVWCEDNVQNAYVFLDLAYVCAIAPDNGLMSAIRNYLSRFLSDDSARQAGGLQQAMLLYSSWLRAFGIMLSDDEKDVVMQHTLDRALQASGEYARRRYILQEAMQKESKRQEELARKRVLEVNPEVFHTREFVVNPKQVFLLTPFGTKTWARQGAMGWRDETYDFDAPRKKLIEPTVAALGLSCIEADSAFAPRQFMEKIWQQINESRLIIADLTSSNPNVLYEAGIAHTLGKPIIFIVQDPVYVPTDLKAIEFVKYESALGKEDEFRERLTRAINHVLS